MGQAVETNNVATSAAGAPGGAGPVAPPDVTAQAAPTAGQSPGAANGAISVRQLKAIARKGGANSADDPFWVSRYFYRKFTVYLTWLCIKLGVSSNAATLISGFAIFAGAVCYVLPSKWAWLAGALLVQLYFVLDHVDGELARYESVQLGKTDPGMSGLFYDTCCHAGELALLAGIGVRLVVMMGDAWWAAAVPLLLVFFPGNIMPWQRYCEAVVAYAGKHVHGDHAALAAEMVRSSSLAWAPSAERLTSGRVISALTQLVGFPGYFVTLLLCTVLDVFNVPTLHVGGRAVPYLLIWLIVRAIHSALAAIKSVRVYGRRLESLR
jgi:hypothetical protein